jgi:hypothetical protein
VAGASSLGVLIRFAGVACVACVLFAAGSSDAQSGQQWRYDAVPWPGGVVRYYNAAPSQGWALWQAVAAWNRSGAKVRFVATSRRNAQLIIRHGPSVASCAKAEATIGFVPNARVLIYPRRDRSRGCNRYRAARSLAHELGHVLGLLHEDGGCAAMNSAGSYSGGVMCPRPQPWEWRCQLLEQDDVRGVVALYGGTVRPQRRASPTCPLYDAIAPPSALSASYDPATGGVTLTAVRAANPLVPAFLADDPRRRATAYAFLVGLGTCPSQADVDTTPRYAWAGQSRFSRLVDFPQPGNYCHAVWSFDALGRPSPRPAIAWVRVPPSAASVFP